MQEDLVTRTAHFVQQSLQQAEAGHDWFHAYRVWQNARLIAKQEGVDELVVSLAALLHDIADSKFHDGDEEIGPATAVAFLTKESASESVIQHVASIIRHISFKGGMDQDAFHSPELEVVRDADRLDAMGAIGIARTFHYGGFKNRAIFDPAIPPITYDTREAYKQSTAPTINHFYEKLLLLKDRMHTATAREMAEKRHAFMEQYLDHFFAEWFGDKSLNSYKPET